MARSEFDQAAAATTLAVLCKRPRIGVGKQRIASDIGARAAATLAQHLLDCVVEDLDAWPGPRVVSPADAGDTAWAADLVDGATVVAQREGNLGVRINALDSALRAAGHQRIVYLGSDAPLIDSVYLASAAAALHAADVVLGAAIDGGVVLMGTAVPWPDLAPLPWSTNDLGDSLAAACARAGLRTECLATGLDVDVVADFVPLARGLDGDDRPARRALARWLSASEQHTPAAARHAT